jgi:hypothetical protein
MHRPHNPREWDTGLQGTHRLLRAVERDVTPRKHLGTHIDRSRRIVSGLCCLPWSKAVPRPDKIWRAHPELTVVPPELATGSLRHRRSVDTTV